MAEYFLASNQDIATIKEGLEQIKSLKCTVYGQGSSGLVGEVRTLEQRLAEIESRLAVLEGK